MENEKSRRSPVGRKDVGTGRGANDRRRAGGRSSTGSVWRIDREDQGGEQGEAAKKPAFYSGFEGKERGAQRPHAARKERAERTDRPRRSNDGSARERGGHGRGSRFEGNDRRGPAERKGAPDRKRYGHAGSDRPWRREGTDERKPFAGRDNRGGYDRSEDDGHRRPFVRKFGAARFDERPGHSHGGSAEREVRPQPTGGKRKRMERTPDDGLVRLNKFVANSGVCSRREADDYIVAGVITVNGVVVNELGARVNPSDDIRFNGERLKGEKKVYVLLNKPKNYVTTVEDPHADRTVMDLVADVCSERIYPVGRLDRNSTGVLLLTNDGELTKQLTHPSYNKLKVYHVFLDKPVTQRDLRTLVEGIVLEDGLMQADAVDYVGDKKSEVGLEIHSGRNRVVRRMFAALGYEVVKLDRVLFAGLTKKNLRRGECRLLTDKEIDMLRMGAYE